MSPAIPLGEPNPALHSIPTGVPDRGPQLNAVYIGMVVPSTIIVAARLGWKYHQPKGLGLDDLFIGLAILADWIHTGLGLATVQYGFGHHAIDLPPSDLSNAIMFWYGCQIVYKFLVAFTKLAVIFLYLRIFSQWNLKRFAHVLAGIVFVGSFAFAIASVFECTPIHRVWDRRIPGTCFNLGASWYAYAAFNTICDLIIITMPIPAIWRLQLKLSQKLSLAAVFLLGWFVVFTSIMRIVSLGASAKSKEPTWGSVNATIWAEVEGGTGIICACLPALRAPALNLYRYCMGKSANDTASRSRQYSEFHEIDKTTGSHANADANKYDNAHGLFNNTPPNRRTRVNDPWGDAIPLSTAQATATRDRDRNSDDDSEERVMGITKTIDFNVSDV
ncbi:hypothetical protein IMSHALPRED_005255 [Imshaugia aleurites]|uniref:Rhodopsin domain-containing protein n=1 Tax=Imshaugia aleurites TaxID=172621 RepID=A0A8H3FIR6_9LECA|nr:hypothetical protein IMSHALPRED_005255 [Imshaugia aleurites]